ncbi:peptidyl-prolyl cis-trans isomerase [Thiomicrorhabdus immobilis]|uniref:Peptidyl-prolyl cis-trans isomerase n=1 Tax=Thiomicrorhabdus immobilis TaxID=2791037 RepID=A0ABM7MDX6_9GAMM|nr:FKBP-type peptidyl-prolyl cis-trans isomerase [Thiomicrorhabdus immobilis]BCN93552.1 peptidyl-prolyl cis-trans isomerase [Thiomicrorhabdus immobilis]
MSDSPKSSLPVVKENSEIAISFKLELADGTLVEETQENEPFRFKIGDGTFINNLENLLVGLELGTTAKLTLSPERAFGLSDPNNFQTMDKADFPEEMALEKGHVIGFNTPTGDEIPGTIHQIEGDKVIVDFNHPLADATVIFSAKIEEIFS